MKKTILIPGGAGYIGSHTAYLLMKQGYDVVILDNFGHNQSLALTGCTVITEDFSNEKILTDIFARFNIDAVMHFAAFIEVGESVKNPKKFYENNVLKTIKLLNVMLKHNIKKIIFSSSCAVYGEPEKTPMDETNPYKPISAYGKNKLAVEFALQDYFTAYDLKYVALRYFNVAGGLPEIGLGEQHDPETHIIPLMIRAIKNNREFKIFGTDYPTKDGSCIRDYVHVLDIADAHIRALQYLDAGGTPDAFNLGSGRGFSVKEMVNATQKICSKYTNNKMMIKEESRRPGDPAILLADPKKAQNILQWKPLHSDLRTILESATEWEFRITNNKTACNIKHTSSL